MKQFWKRLLCTLLGCNYVIVERTDTQSYWRLSVTQRPLLWRCDRCGLPEKVTHT